jgi:hypothetical protein
VDEIPILGRNDDHSLVKHFLAHYDVPAYVRRARRVQDAFDHLVGCCRRQRDEWLTAVAMRLRLLGALAGDWRTLRPLLRDDDQVHALHQLEAVMGPSPHARQTAPASVRPLRRALRSLQDSIERFNRRWQQHLCTVDLTHINALRDGYNRYYLLEKECALRSARLARQGFRRLEPVTVDQLAALLPLLPVPQAEA